MLINEQISRSQVANPISTLPSIATDDVVSLMRIDKSFGTARISNAIMDAYDIINRQISPWRAVQDERFVRAYKERCCMRRRRCCPTFMLILTPSDRGKFVAKT